MTATATIATPTAENAATSHVASARPGATARGPSHQPTRLPIGMPAAVMPVRPLKPSHQLSAAIIPGVAAPATAPARRRLPATRIAGTSGTSVALQHDPVK